MNKEILYKAKKETQLLIKSEAEKNLQDIHKSEDLMTGKINKFLSFSVAIFIAVIGYSVKAISEDKIDALFILSISLSIVFALIIVILFNSIFPTENRLLGSEPSNLLHEDMIKGDEYDELRILGNRILCIQNDIKISLSSYRKRLNSYKNSNKILAIGILFTLLNLLFFFFINVSARISFWYLIIS
ncbi:hypothetical protein [Tenacibaculum finnmarkense]|uniref:hypothetical protein n=1 Tax=Tenacibaculum finnmarkense TaxID=2781243 RepID=UPI001EFA90CF|nr:hypothetical protein [Tenacibaculum finnmarkense]MCG8860035.1 hypothetical protein [Tenacibaculum finnmarkense]